MDSWPWAPSRANTHAMSSSHSYGHGDNGESLSLHPVVSCHGFPLIGFDVFWSIVVVFVGLVALFEMKELKELKNWRNNERIEESW